MSQSYKINITNNAAKIFIFMITPIIIFVYLFFIYINIILISQIINFEIILQFIEKIAMNLSIIIILMNIFRIIINQNKGLSAADKNFRDSGWAGHQIGILSFQNMNKMEWISKKKKVENNFNNFSYKNSEILKISELKSKEWLNIFLQNQPDENRSFCIIIFENEQLIIFLANHTLCDGHILYIILTICFNLSKPLITPKYSRKPIISELMIIQYIIKRFIKNIKYNPLPIENLNRRYFIKIPYIGKGRWEVFGKIFDILYQSLDKNVNTLRIAFTVAWDDKTTRVHNRIGVIIIDIPRCINYIEYSKIIKKQILKNKYDALTSYELVRNYSINQLRKKFCKTIDGVCTTFPIREKILDIDTWYGGFAGNLKAPFYLNAITLSDIDTPYIGLSIQTCTSLFSHNNFMKFEHAKSYCDLYNYPCK